MKLPVIVSDAATDQLFAAARWWSENRSAEQAERWHRQFVSAIESIGDRPVRFPLAWENQFFADDIRELLFGLGRRPTHRALFIVRSERVYVFAVRHVAQEPLEPESLDISIG